MIHTIGTWGASLFNTSAGPTLALGMALVFAQVAWAAAPAKPARSSSAKAAAPQAPALKGDPLLGKDKADAERCIECHGQTGQGSGHPNGAEARVAKLAGQKTAYIVKQVQDFRSGQRKQDQMAIVARNLSDEDLVDIAAYFNSLPPMSGDGGGPHEVGKQLYEQGDATRGITACVSCHGANGAGQGSVAAAPRLAGQEWKYLDDQLRSWRDGSRRNSPDGAMSQLAKALSDREIEVLANHLASQAQ